MTMVSVIRRALTPVLSLTGGLGTLLLLRRGIGFAPISLGIAVVAWISAGLFARYFSGPRSDVDEKPLPRRRRVLRWVGRSVVVGLYQNVLFFLLPIWFGSAEPTSANIAFPVLLAALALFSCFDAQFARWVLERRGPRTVAGAALLFSVSVPALALQNVLPLGIGVAVCAAVATLAATLFGLRQGAAKTLAAGLLLAALAGALFYSVATWLPPVPVQCVTKVAAARIEKRIPLDIAEIFSAGTPKVNVHFSVAAPEHFRQQIGFQWYVNGKKRGRPIPSSITGGRKQGFRTWTYKSRPHRGRYRVDLVTDEGQLVARVRFHVR
jgi:hypothetical protein